MLMLMYLELQMQLVVEWGEHIYIFTILQIFQIGANIKTGA